MPVCEAMASMRSFIDSNSGPDRSERKNFSRNRYACIVNGSSVSTLACGFSSRLRLVLLKNWREIATWRSSI